MRIQQTMGGPGYMRFWPPQRLVKNSAPNFIDYQSLPPKTRLRAGL